MMKSCGNRDSEPDEDLGISRIGIVTRSMSKNTPMTTNSKTTATPRRPISSSSTSSGDDDIESAQRDAQIFKTHLEI